MKPLRITVRRAGPRTLEFIVEPVGSPVDLERKVDDLLARVGRVEAWVGDHGERLDTIEQRSGELAELCDRRIESLSHGLGSADNKFADIVERVEWTESRAAELLGKIRKTDKRVEELADRHDDAVLAAGETLARHHDRLGQLEDRSAETLGRLSALERFAVHAREAIAKIVRVVSKPAKGKGGRA